jgi:hypothetical protein
MGGGRILWACFVQTGVIDTHPLFPVFLSDQYRVGQPLGAINFMDKPGSKEFANLFLDGLAFFFVKVS